MTQDTDYLLICFLTEFGQYVNDQFYFELSVLVCLLKKAIMDLGYSYYKNKTPNIETFD